MLGIAEAAPNRVASFFVMNGEDNHLTREYLSGNSPGEMRRGMSPYSIARRSVAMGSGYALLDPHGKLHRPLADFPMMDDPQKVVDAIVAISLRPKEELAVGWKAKASYAGHHIMPDVTERFTGNVAHKSEMGARPPAPATSGALYEPMQAGTAVSGGMRERSSNGASQATKNAPDTAQENGQPSANHQ